MGHLFFMHYLVIADKMWFMRVNNPCIPEKHLVKILELQLWLEQKTNMCSGIARPIFRNTDLT
uniref:Uncharacterized protein n=1 Tax=Anguilla anguilla TaxID=7936 RepID=A0A0E9S4Y0_ANGAN